ncbi:ABC transporter substrate-binding protein [Rhodospirillaceae bacterium SYSU D60014]|uniref:ABC transporter substrate-binding protein n=1 Tax=Virgifigura deserti TaxID=2268457 RepID=UPI000E66D194
MKIHAWKKALAAGALAAGLAVAGTATAETIYKVGSTPTGIPFTFLDIETNSIQGMMVDLIDLVAKEAGFEVEVEATPFSSLIPALTSNKIDIISAAMIATDEREEVIDFSDPVFPYGEGLVVAADDQKEYKSFDDLEGAVVGVQVGTIYIEPLQQSGAFQEVRIYDSLADILRDVNLGRIKAGFGDKPILAYQLSQGKYPDVRLVQSYESVVAGPVALGVRQEDDELLSKINEALAKLKAAGEIDRLAKKWNVK